MEKVDKYPNFKEKYSLYPTIEQVETSQFRLLEISELKTKLENEVSEQAILSKKYKRSENIFDGVDIGANSIALVLSVT